MLRATVSGISLNTVNAPAIWDAFLEKIKRTVKSLITLEMIAEKIAILHGIYPNSKYF